MRQVLYISSAPGLGETEVDAILATSRTNNAERGITGFLLYNGRNFMQLLEGEESNLRWLLRRLSTDPRHTGVVRLSDNAVSARVCDGWTMKRIRFGDDVESRRDKLACELPDGLSPEIRRLVLNFAALN